MYGYRVVRTYPHDPKAFTQGLQFVDGFLYEGTGLNGSSSIRKVKLETGEVVQKRDLARAYFGEGITVWKTDLIQLTWQSNVAFVYDKTTFAPRRTFKYKGEGWGLTHDGTNLIMSDGTDQLRVLDPATFAERRRIKVTAVGAPLRDLNELEYMKGEILANVWTTDSVARVSPDTGRVTGYIDLQRPPDAGRTALGGRAERHRLRREERSPVRHRQALAQGVRDQDQSRGKSGHLVIWSSGH